MSFERVDTEPQRPRVLILANAPAIRGVLTGLLGNDYSCAECGSAKEALGLLDRGGFELILCDIEMRGMNGLDLVPLVRERAPDTPVIVLSSMQNVETAVRAMRAGAFDYVTKPFDLRHVEAAVRRALEHQSLCASKRRYENYLEEMVARKTEQLNRALDSLERAYRSTLKALTAALEMRDHETRGHSNRVVAFSLRLGRELGFDAERLTSLEFGALLHDIGKIGVPDAILRKPAALNEAEREHMRLHPVYGQQILGGIEFLKGAARVVAQHHEQWDGSGYPSGLKGHEIDLNARIFAVADAFDAMTSDRVYRRALPYEAASAELSRCAGTQFDPRIVDAFHRVGREEWEKIRGRAAARVGGSEEVAGDVVAARVAVPDPACALMPASLATRETEKAVKR